MTAQQHLHNHGRVRVHQGAKAEGCQAQQGDRMRRSCSTQTELHPHGDGGNPRARVPHQRVL
jgi:hypothetical protein